MRLVTATVLLGCLWTHHTPCSAQDAATLRQQRTVELLKRTAAEISARSLARFDELEDWEAARPELRRRFLYMLGLDPMPERTPLEARITGKLERTAYRIEKIVFQSLPGLYVTGNFYVPSSPPGPRATVLYVCGHSPHPLGAKWSYQDHAAWFAEHGYNCLIIDTLEFGEVAGIHHGTHDLNLWNWLSLGYTPAGVETWNAVRAVDYLETRAEVDREQIAITGRSGGGVVSWYAAAVDERIAASVPVCGTFTFGSQAADWLAGGQCDCIYFHNTYLIDLPEVAALIAPRPLRIVSGRQDSIFPPSGYREVYRKVKTIYDLHEASDRISEVDEDVGHKSTPLMRKAAREWLNRWLRSDTEPPELAPIPAEKRESPEDLACLEKLPQDAINYSVHRSFVDVAELEKPKSLFAWNARRRSIVDELKEKTFRWFPDDEIAFKTEPSRNRGGWANRYADYEDAQIESEPGSPIRIQLLRAKKRAEKTPLLVHVKGRGASFYPFDIDELLPLLGRYDVAILNPRLTESTDEPLSAAEYADIERTAAWVGRTVASMQVWDILRAVEWLVDEKKLSPEAISVHGKGEMGIVALYAGLLNERIGRVILHDPPPSHWRGPALLNVLRITDLPEAAAALAPREIVFLRKMPPAYQFTREIYDLGPPGRLKTARSLPEALEVWRY